MKQAQDSGKSQARTSRSRVRWVTVLMCASGENARMRATAEPEQQATTHIERELLFQDRHPELAAFLSEIEGTYARCQGHPPEDLESAWRHVFQDCAWCGEEFEQLRKLKSSFLG